MRITPLIIGLLVLTSLSFADSPFSSARSRRLTSHTGKPGFFGQMPELRHPPESARTVVQVLAPGRIWIDDPLVPTAGAESAEMTTRSGTSLAGIVSIENTARDPMRELFDTVYVHCGPHDVTRRTYQFVSPSQRDEVVQRLSQGIWVDEELTTSVYSENGLLLRSTRERMDPLGIVEITRGWWDYELHQRCLQRETAKNPGDPLQLSYFECRGFDEQGTAISYEWQIWDCGSQIDGFRYSNRMIDGCTVVETAIWTGNGWTDRVRWTSITDTSTETRTVTEERWSGSTWTNAWRRIWTVNEQGRLAGSLGYEWIDNSWAITFRNTVTYRPDGLSWEELDERWEDNNWMPNGRSLTTLDDQHRQIERLSQEWDHRWMNRWHMESIYSADGSCHTTDSSWTSDGLEFTSMQQNNAEGEFLKLEWCVWARGFIQNGWRQSRSFTPSGRIDEIVRGFWLNGQWETDDRYRFSYDANELLAALRHDTWANADWQPSIGSRASSNDWETSAAGDPFQRQYSFSGFSELRFAYRDQASEVPGVHAPIPLETTLRQNYPNPFNPTTTIPFAVSSGARTTLVVYDILGREVARPADEWKDPGEYNVKFDASGLASGMYITRFTSGTVTQTKKMVLMR